MKNNYITIAIIILACISSVNSEEELLSLTWKYDVAGSASHVHLFKVDEYGNMGVVTGASIYTTAGAAGWFTALDSEGNYLWEKKGFLSINSMAVTDLDLNGRNELIAGISQYIYSMNDKGSTIWKVATGPQNTINDIVIADINDDGFDEVIAGGESLHYPNIYVVDRNGKIVWKVRAPEGVNSIAVGDINNNGNLEVVSGTVGKYGVYYKASYVNVYDKNGKAMWDQRTARGISKVYLADLDGDNYLEIFLGSLHNLWVMDYKGNDVLHFETKGYIWDILVDDIDSDGNNEIILGSNDLYVLSQSGSLKWTNSAGSETIYDLELIDIDADGNNEILAASDGLYLVDYNGDTKWEYSTDKAVKSIYIGDLDGDSFNDIIAGSLDKNIYVFTTTMYQKRKEAERYHSKAKNYYAAGNLEEALENARKAKEYFRELEDDAMVDDINKLISNIQSSSEQLVQDDALAYSYYNRSRTFYIQGVYMNASYWAEKAIYKYSEVLHNDSMTTKSEEIYNNSQKFIINEAEDYLNKLKADYRESDYDNALLNAEYSYDRYVWLEDRNKTIEVLEYTADVYYAFAEEQRSSGDFFNASISAQKALFIYKCIDGSHPEYPPKCFPDDAPVIDIIFLVDEIRNLSYDGSPYINESLKLKSLILLISENKTGSMFDNINLGDFGNPFGPVIGFFSYLINLISWNFMNILVIGALVFIIVLLLLLLSMVTGRDVLYPIKSRIKFKIKLPRRGKSKPVFEGGYTPEYEPRGEREYEPRHEPRFEPVTKPTYEPRGDVEEKTFDESKIGFRRRPKYEPFEEEYESFDEKPDALESGEVEKIRKDARKGVGATLKSLKELDDLEEV